VRSKLVRGRPAVAAYARTVTDAKEGADFGVVGPAGALVEAEFNAAAKPLTAGLFAVGDDGPSPLR
jgi:hypothetical protein